MIAVKRFLAAVVMLGIVLGVAPLAYASEPKQMPCVEIEPFFTHIALINANLSINNNGRATMSGMVIGHTGTTHIISEVVLYQVNADGTFTRLHSSGEIRIEGSIWAWTDVRSVARGHYYRVTVYTSVFRNREIESAYKHSAIVRAN